jgi:Flp pilus assembly protein TadB
MSECMRTTLTLDDDVAALLDALRRKRKANLKAPVNEALRRGLQEMTAPSKQRPPFRTRSVSAGRVLVGAIDNTAEVLAVAEGEDFACF